MHKYVYNNTRLISYKDLHRRKKNEILDQTAIKTMVCRKEIPRTKTH